MKFFSRILILFWGIALISCSNSDEPKNKSKFDISVGGLFVVNQGNFNTSNSSLTFYSSNNILEQNIFFRANDARLGDVAQSMTIDSNSTGWVVVNNSHIIFAINTNTFKEKGRITGLNSPRNIHFVSPTKAYVTQMYDNRIAIVNPTRYSITGYITVADDETSNGSTEMMVQIGNYVYVNCWSYNNKILKIDASTDEIIDILEVAIQPKSMTKDANDNLWVLTDGGYFGSPYGYEQPKIIKIRISDFSVDRTFDLPMDVSISTITTDGTGTQLYWASDNVYTMSIDSETLPSTPLIDMGGNYINAMTVDANTGDIYIADAIDYVQNGRVLIYGAEGTYKTEFNTGICPGGFCWKK